MLTNPNPITTDDLLEFAPPIADGMTPDTAVHHALTGAEGLVEGYTRGRHLDATGGYRPGIRAVLLQVAARILANPGQVTIRVQSGAVVVSKGPGFSGFTLAEQAVLNRYRKRGL